MSGFLSVCLIVVYFSLAGILMVYGLNCYIMIFLFKRGEKAALAYRGAILNDFAESRDRERFPLVTTQIPIFNEYNVAERVIRAACNIRYPKGKHEIQVLDDSTDETCGLVDGIVSELRENGHDILVIRRDNRKGYKAGALAEGTNRAKGELLAVFDADFMPPGDFLLRTVPFFLADDGLGLAQARWGHMNRRGSLLTRAQSIGIDGHFMVEQSARNWSGLFMNFNGTAGIWRKQAILDGGGWHWDTLTEDMDLSYRVQFAEWRTIYLPDLVVPAEIPEDIRAFKSQQFRWAKGSIQTALKHLPGIFRSPVRPFKKIEAFFHLTHYIVHPIMATLSILALPVLLIMQAMPGPFLFACLALALCLAMAAPSALYLVSQRAAYENWGARIVWMPFLVIIGVGIAISNSKAVVEALLGRESGFVRTPKKGSAEVKKYRVPFSWTAGVEVALGMYCAMSLGYYLAAGKYLVGPFLAAYATGFLFVGILTIVHSAGYGK